MDPIATNDEPRDARGPTNPPLPLYQGAPPSAANPPAAVPPSSATPDPGPPSPTDDVPERPTGLPITIRMEGAQTNCVGPHILGTVYRIAALALSILEQEHSVKQLVCIGVTSIQVWGTGRDPKRVQYPTTPCDDGGGWYMTPSDDEMGWWVQFYLQKIRHCLPTLNICDLGAYGGSMKVRGMFTPRNWVRDAEDRCISAGQEPNNGNVMLHWDPLDVGVIHFDTEVSI